MTLELSKRELLLIGRILSEKLDTFKLEKSFYRTAKNNNKIKNLELILSKIQKVK